MTVREEILRGAAATLWWSVWADHVGANRCRSLMQQKIEDIAPPVPAVAHDLVERLLTQIEKEHGLGVASLYEIAVSANGGQAKEPERFGSCLAHMSMGTGVSWFDDHARFPLTVPHTLEHDTGDVADHADVHCEDCARIKNELLESVLARGFDESEAASPGERGVHVRCSQCQALVVSGVATHEHGCPNARLTRRDDTEEEE